jgi:hypothetical protein
MTIPSCRKSLVSVPDRPLSRLASLHLVVEFAIGKEEDARTPGRFSAQIPSAVEQLPCDLKRDEGLARAGGHREQNAWPVLGDGLHHPLDGEVLVIAARVRATLVLERNGALMFPSTSALSASWSVDVKGIDKATFDLSVKNPNGGEEVAHRSPQAIMDEIASRYFRNRSHEVCSV